MDPLKDIKKLAKKSGPKGKKKFQVKVKINLWTILMGFFVLLFILPVFFAAYEMRGSSGRVELSQMLTDIKEGKIENVMVENERMILTYKEGGEVKYSVKESTESFTDVLSKSGIDPTSVKYTIVDQTLTKAFGDILGTLLPIILMAALFFFIFRAQTKGAQDIFSFGRSKAKLFAKGKQDVTFADVAGVDDAKKELEEIVDFLKNPAKYRKIGARTPKGVLLFGPAGVGKTLLARACAGQAGVPFFSIAGSEFMEMLVGVGASVTGDTPILIKKDEKVELSPIGEFIDQFYNSDKEGILKVNGLKTLGLKPEINGFWGSRSSKRPVFGGSRWQNVESVYRHKVKEIYEIKFLGGRLRTTGDHSVFIREHGGIREKETRTLKTGDVLVNLPAKTRAWNPRLRKNDHFIKKHEFSEKISETFLDVWQDDPKELKKYDYVLAMQGTLSQYAIAGQTGVSQATIGNWQGGIHEPQLLSKKLVKLNLPNKVKVTPSLMRLFGYYTAEGRGQGNLNFTFNIAEKDFVQDVTELMETVFGLSNPKLEITDTNTVRVIYYSAHLGRFFANHCGLGSHNKHLPSFIWDLPFKYFVEFLRGYWRGDGYETKSGKLSMTSVSHRLIRELAWLCSMHGIKVGIKHEILKLGRSNLNGKPFPEGECWSLIIGKTSNPFKKKKHPYQFKRAIVKSVERKKFDGYVYDLCGVEKEAFFGGETPILLHNSRARDLFAQAKTAAPSIIFIDEIDAIGRQRGRGLVGGHDEREQTLNQILVEMDGFTPNDNVIVIAATNRGDLLDPALLRPGRFDRRVVLDMPDKEGRLAILKIHARGKKFKQDIKWGKIADRTVGFSGADLENMLNEAAILAAREGKATIGEKEAEEAATKVKLGPAKRKLQSDEDRKITAYHEGGHAIVTHSLDKMDPVQRISIVARGMSLGHTLIPPAADRSHETKSRIIQQISAMLGGRAAEQVIFNEMTSGASNDIAQATRLARAMVIEWGMSPLGPINLGPDTGTGEFGQMEWYEGAKVSPGMQDRIDNEVKKIVDESYKGALEIVKRKRKVLDKIADALLQKETIGREEFEKIVGEKTGK